MRRRAGLLAALAAALAVAAALAAPAPRPGEPEAPEAGVAGWRLSEVLLAGSGGDPGVRFVEVHAAAGGCWFPSTQLVTYDGAGATLDVVAPFVETTCFEGETYLLFATSAAEAAFGVTATRAVAPAAPPATRQLCLRATATIYDCVRWGAVTTPIHDLFGPDDDTAAAAPPPGLALARIDDTDVIADDWIVAAPTPGAPDDGSPWTPDAGVPDGGAPDAGPPPDANPDAGPPPDARDQRFLDLDAQGGAGCGCRAGGGPGGAVALLLGLAAALARRRRGQRRAPP